MSDPTTRQRLAGKVAIVTGGASGIGEATARLFAHHGAAVVIADIQDDKGRDVAASTIGCTYVHCDVSDEQQVKSLVDSTVEAHGRLDIMFSNAGTFNPGQTVLSLDLEAMDRLLGVNVRGMAACVKHAGRVMAAEGGGSIVCTGSYYARAGEDNMTDYVMTKHAVLGLVRCASRQLGEYGVRVNCVSPGLVATPLVWTKTGMGPEEAEAMVGPRTSLCKGVTTVEQVAEAVLFLASAESVFVTGHDLASRRWWV